ncbi:hypothetical protein [Spongiactinospora sp. TRM90649]|uniref:hypothetical protein n=1 Tax=Spongiactinospora sp. TRM90649 TaxID=3031114 RepID=UPI0023F8F179|nr:hypothetical protein [Spongiactinospora sp. TRM90649]MDF5754675.1 hypothetical protein [Spongiactinospora sp. TRM90649]
MSDPSPAQESDITDFADQDDDVIASWEVDAGKRGSAGVTGSAAVAATDMLAALAAFPDGRGRVRSARLMPSMSGAEYRYGATVLTAHRRDAVTPTVSGDAWDLDQ